MAMHLGVCGKAVVPSRLNDRCHLVPPQVCQEEVDEDINRNGQSNWGEKMLTVFRAGGHVQVDLLTVTGHQAHQQFLRNFVK